MSSSWVVERHRGSATDLHGLVPPEDGRRRIWVLDVSRPAVVLGSTQDAGAVDERAARAAGVDVARRRSGGGAVWVAPGEPTWIDVVVPRDDPLWSDDVAGAFAPVGRAWASALAELGLDGATVHDGPLVRTEWSDLVCFAGTGPGEVLHPDGGKVVGISQRRTRGAARFQCALPRRWEPGALAALLVAPDGRPLAEVPGALDALRLAGAGLAGPTVDEVVHALVGALTTVDLG